MGGMMGGMGGGRRGGRRRLPDTNITVPVTLDQCYNGYKISVPHTPSIPCGKCKGKGSKNGAPPSAVCRDCGGQGAVIQVIPIGPGMMQQVQAPCDVCLGEGMVVRDKDKCPACNGQRLIPQESVLEVEIEKGMAEGQQIPYLGQGDGSPDPVGNQQQGQPQRGNVVVELQLDKHAYFTREGDDLIFNRTVSIAEALVGTKFIITHLDGRKLLVDTSSEVIKVGDSRTIIGEGMPVWRNPGKKKEILLLCSKLSFQKLLAKIRQNY
eukprot:PhF_6_TR20768/c0_g1_i2/m.29804/K09503/DNAJA2; DnaJ homolog subfamily A member 2